MADGAWGCIMADEMGLGAFSSAQLRVFHDDADMVRQDIAVYSPIMDTAQAIPNSRKRYL